jgi:phosphatidylserine decarboxylase
MIAREGLPFILTGMALTIILSLAAARMDSRTLFVLALFGAVLSIFLTWFFRDPNRTAVLQGGMLVAPADGRVVGIEPLGIDSTLGYEAVRLSIFLSIFDVHVNRSPVAGRISDITYTPGKFVAAFKSEASDVNERNSIRITTGERDIVVTQIAGVLARRIVCKVLTGDTVTAGGRIGLIRFGSRVDITVPHNTRFDVSLGQHVKAGATVLGVLPNAGREATAENTSENSDRGFSRDSI